MPREEAKPAVYVLQLMHCLNCTRAHSLLHHSTVFCYGNGVMKQNTE